MSNYSKVKHSETFFYKLFPQMTAVNFNPYSWDNSSKAIQSSVTSLELQNGNTKINVSNLDEDIVMVIPISSPPQNDANSTEDSEHRFLKPNKMVVHSYYAELGNVPVIIETGVFEMDVVIDLFVKFGSRPAIDNFDHSFTISFKYTCIPSQEGNDTSCFLEKGLLTVVPPIPGRLYVGISGKKNSSERTRNRRSCFGHGRQRRGCVGFKDPPPKGVTKTIVPQYEPSTDINYTMTIIQSSCLYWSEDKDKWSSDGCKVYTIYQEISKMYATRNDRLRGMTKYFTIRSSVSRLGGNLFWQTP